MTDRPSSLAGVRFGAVTRHADARGSFRELWRASAFPALTAAETGAPAAPSRGSSRRTSRRRPPASCAASTTTAASSTTGSSVAGRALVALVDVRPLLDRDAATGPLVETRELAADEWVVIPAGVAHGFLALEPLELLYLVTNEFDGIDELGFAWDDPAVGVPWPAVEGTPDGRPILSDRDRSNPPLAELVAAASAS